MFYLLNKEKGISSFKAIRNFASEREIKKFGHTGTLDPLATGLLLIATDDDTKLIDYVDKGIKSYTATMTLGKTTDTYDSEGEVTSEDEVVATDEEIISVINSFVGTYDQVPPKFSAKKVDGKRAYSLAREGKEVELKAVSVTISKIEDVKKVETNVFQFTVEVSRGTYIRSLIFDMGQALECGAFMSDLERITIGSLTMAQANQEIDIKDLLTLDLIETEKMKEIFRGIRVETKARDGKYGLLYKDDIFGIVKVKKGWMTSFKLFGNKFTKEGF